MGLPGLAARMEAEVEPIDEVEEYLRWFEARSSAAFSGTMGEDEEEEDEEEAEAGAGAIGGSVICLGGCCWSICLGLMGLFGLLLEWIFGWVFKRLLELLELG